MSNDMHDDPFNRLRDTNAPDPRAEARQRALAAGMAAFEAAQADAAKKNTGMPQGSGWGPRLTSIITSLKGKSIMDMRIPIGTAAVALLLLPLGYQLYSTTSMTPADAVVQQPVTIEQAPTPAPAPASAPAAEVAEAATPAPKQEPTTEAEAPVDTRARDTTAPATAPTLAVAPEPLAEERAVDSNVLTRQAESFGTTLAPAPMPTTAMTPNAGATADAYYMPLPPQTTPAEPSGDEFTSFDEQPLKVVADAPVSTFSIDVDTASYAYTRTLLEDGFVPEPDAVRIEEMINYFPYDYPAASVPDVPFKPTMAVYPTPWNPKTQLLHIGIKGYVPEASEDKAANLVFLIDTSGSMDEPDKLPLLKRAFSLLVDQLSANDTVSIVVYAGSAGVVLEPTKATDKVKILDALGNLAAGGSTAGAEGIELAYRLAEQAKLADGTNRVILATDGDFNVGIDDPEGLETFIRGKRDSGITLSVLGFGQGNLGDDTMQALAQNGNGNASYISSFREAQKVLVEEMGGTLDMIAKDVKIQVEFNPAVVAEYRLIGYETRALNREDFNNDKVDAGDIGAGHTVTAIYEITPVGSGAELVDPLRYGQEAPATATAGADEIAFLRLRYKLPDSDVSQLIEQPVTPDVVYGDIAEVSDDMRFAAAVAAFGQKLKGSVYGSGMDWDDIAALARSGRGEDEGGYRAEFVSLISTAALLKPDTDTDPCDVSTSSDDVCE